MASQTPMAIYNENVHIHTGKGAAIGSKVNVPKSEQKGHKARKALADISKGRKPSLGCTPKISSLKDKSAIQGSLNLKNTPKSYDLTEEETKKCSEWAKEGIEHVHFSGNDMRGLQNDLAKERVDKEVESVMSALSGWMVYGLEKPLEEDGKHPEDFIKLELDPEVLLPFTISNLTSGEEESLFLEDENDLMPCRDYSFDFKLKEEDNLLMDAPMVRSTA